MARLSAPVLQSNPKPFPGTSFHTSFPNSVWERPVFETLFRHTATPCLIFLLLLCGCEESERAFAPTKSNPPPSPAVSLNSGQFGSVQGRVTWKGPVPTVPEVESWPFPAVENGPRPVMHRPNPNRPLVDTKTDGVGNAVVFLRGAHLSRGRPWDLPPVRVEMSDTQFHVRQGKADSGFGFVRVGDTVEFVSLDPAFHALHVDGVDFFTLMFPDPNRPLCRPLSANGVVELTSAAGYNWMRAYVFVDDHPYYCRTDRQGNFRLDKVPPGESEVVCWVPNWNEARHEREPETGLIYRLFFRPPVTQTKSVSLASQGAVTVNFELSAELFTP